MIAGVLVTALALASMAAAPAEAQTRALELIQSECVAHNAEPAAVALNFSVLSEAPQQASP